MWADGFNGVYHHISDRVAFVVSTPDPPSVQADFAAMRGWKFPIISTLGTSFKVDMGFEKDGYYYPGVSIFKRDENQVITHYTKAAFGPGDDYCNVWSLFDLLPTREETYIPKKPINKRSMFELTTNIAVQVKDYEKAIQFYEKVIGMDVQNKNQNETKMTINGVNFYIENENKNHVFFEFAVVDIDRAKEVLLNEGCIIKKAYSDRSFMIQDPYGLRFHLYQI